MRRHRLFMAMLACAATGAAWNALAVDESAAPQDPPTSIAEDKKPPNARPVPAKDLAPPVAPAPVPSLPRRAGEFLPYVCEPAFGGLTFWDPLLVRELPDGSHRLLVVERRGKILLLEERDGRWAQLTFADLRPRVVLSKGGAEEGLLGLAFHPQFAVEGSPHRGEFFVSYTGRSGGAITNRVSRLRTRAGRGDEADLAAEEVLIDQPDLRQEHNGGCLEFGPDGMLYVSRGDDNLPAPNPHVQRIDGDLFSGILRLDVDCRGGKVSHPPPRQPVTGRTAGYFIPNDNPFVGRPNALEEFYAIGLRNPWRFTFDRANGRLYAADVGDSRREEVNVIGSGSNCQWNFREGSLVCRDFDANAAERPKELLGVETSPWLEYGGAGAAYRCIIGGYVYRGKKLPELAGRYIFADQSGRIFAAELLDGGARSGPPETIAATGDEGVGISSLGEDAAGELYFCSIGQLASDTGRIYRLRRTQEEDRSTMPPDLASTGLFADWRTLTPPPAVVPYEVRVPFWSDGAEKRRWIAPPKETLVDRGVLPGRFTFPPGTVFVKHFEMAMDDRRPEVRRPLETRILVCDDHGGAFGATYRWSPDGAATHLVTHTETEELVRTRADGSEAPQTWTYPGRLDCARCHNGASGWVLGFTLRQLECPPSAALATRQSQLGYFIRTGLIAADVILEAMQAPSPHLIPLGDETAPLDYRVRSYLEVNCAICHNPNRQIAAFDARILRPPEEQGILDGATYYHQDLGPQGRIVAPGDDEHSALLLRLESKDPSIHMPPIGVNIVDQTAVEAVRRWIRSMPRNPVPPGGPVALPAEPRDDLPH